MTGDGTISGKYISDFSKYDANWKYPSQHIFFSRIKANAHEKVNHPTQKPIKLLEHFIMMAVLSLQKTEKHFNLFLKL